MVLVARRGDRLQTIADQYKNVEVLTADLLTAEGVAAVEARLRDTTKPPVDFVVNNAGFGTSGPMHRIDPNRLANEVQLNVVALMCANLVGFVLGPAGLLPFLRETLARPRMALAVLGALFSGVQLMLALRQHEAFAAKRRPVFEGD